MFKQVVTHKGFWKSVVLLAIAFVLVFLIIKWILEGFSFAFLVSNNPLFLILGSILAGLFYGFFVSYGKFNARIKKNRP